MIEFDGYLTGAAEKRLLKQIALFRQNMLLAGILLIAFPMIQMASVMHLQNFTVKLLVSMLIIVPLLAWIPMNEKEKRQTTPKKIYTTEDGYIICITDKAQEVRGIDDVKRVYDRGEYYEIKFCFGKLSSNYICQKSLLAKGTLAEFEHLFGDRIKK